MRVCGGVAGRAHNDHALSTRPGSICFAWRRSRDFSHPMAYFPRQRHGDAAPRPDALYRGQILAALRLEPRRGAGDGAGCDRVFGCEPGCDRGEFRGERRQTPSLPRTARRPTRFRRCAVKSKFLAVTEPGGSARTSPRRANDAGRDGGSQGERVCSLRASPDNGTVPPVADPPLAPRRRSPLRPSTVAAGGKAIFSRGCPADSPVPSCEVASHSTHSPP